MKYCHDPPFSLCHCSALLQFLIAIVLDCQLSGGRELADPSILAHCSYSIYIVGQMVSMIYLNRLLTRFAIYICACPRFSLNSAARVIFLIKIF